MSDEIREIVKTFRSDNGNKNFTNKELIIYFNKKHESDIKDLKEQITNLPCQCNSTRLTKIETTNKVLIVILGIAFTAIGLIMNYIK